MQYRAVQAISDPPRSLIKQAAPYNHFVYASHIWVAKGCEGKIRLTPSGDVYSVVQQRGWFEVVTLGVVWSPKKGPSSTPAKVAKEWSIYMSNSEHIPENKPGEGRSNLCRAQPHGVWRAYM